MKETIPYHLDKETQDGALRNLDALFQLFPSCFTEAKDVVTGEMRRVVNWGKLRSLLGEYVEDGEPEKYDFTWVGKRAAQREAAKPCRKTLRPCPEESVNWENTQNLYIEGDNLEVLKLLQNSYMGKVKMIYIDPPYNTGKDFVYHDSFAQSIEEYDARNKDEDGNRFRRNTDSNGRFHSDWCSMLYTRLLIARSFLQEDGTIFISIDDNEVQNIRNICNEIFGERNFIAQIVVNGTPKNDPYVVSTAHEYCIVYCKNLDCIKEANYGVTNPVFSDLETIYQNGKGDFALIQEKLKQYYIDNDLLSDNISNYKYADKNGIYRIGPIDDPQSSGPHDDRINPKTGHKCATPTRGWSCTLATWKDWVRDNLIEFPDTDDRLPSKKTYATSDRLDVMRALFKMQTRKDTDALKKLFGLKFTPFSNPKPVMLLKQFIENCNDKKMTIMDFFSGSGTFMHACILQNSEDGGHRNCILIQYPEQIEVSASQSNKEKKISLTAIEFLKSIGKDPKITEIAKERIRRIGKKIKAENSLTTQDLDIGFRVLKCDESNFKPVAFGPSSYSQTSLDDYLDNIKEERSGLDLLFDCMMRWGLELSLPYSSTEVDGCTIYNVDDGNLVACFEGKVTEAVIDAIAQMHPLRVVFRDSSFTEAAQKMNLFELFKQKCSWTDQEVQNNVRVI